jgi:hypothetical protein
MLHQHRTLVSALDSLPMTAREVIAVGRSVLALAREEGRTLSVLLSLLEPAVRDDLSAEHQLLADDVALLEWLLETTPASPDVSALAESLACRLREHLERDSRLLERAARLEAHS